MGHVRLARQSPFSLFRVRRTSYLHPFYGWPAVWNNLVSGIFFSLLVLCWVASVVSTLATPRTIAATLLCPWDFSGRIRDWIAISFSGFSLLYSFLIIRSSLASFLYIFNSLWFWPPPAPVPCSVWLAWLHFYSLLYSPMCHLYPSSDNCITYIIISLHHWKQLKIHIMKRIKEKALFCPDNIRWHSDNCVFVKKQLAQIRNTSQQMCFVKGYVKLNREYFRL